VFAKKWIDSDGKFCSWSGEKPSSSQPKPFTVFSSLVNLHDFVLLGERLRRKGISWTASKFSKPDKERVKSSWAHTTSETSNWWDIPEVGRRNNLLMTGSPELDHQTYLTSKYLTSDRTIEGLSLGCGAGSREVRWTQVCERLKLTCCDISRERISQARANAAEAGLADRLSFKVADVNSMELGRKVYDLILIEGALHHFFPISSVLEKVAEALRDNGLFILNDYIGPSRFQWTASQLEGANRILRMIPENYRVRFGGRGIKKRVYRPGRLSMYLNDPSEAAESGLIEQAVLRRFTLLERKDYGGTLLQLVFKDIAHNFLNEREETKSLLERIFSIEDEMLKGGAIASDLTLFVCGNR